MKSSRVAFAVNNTESIHNIPYEQLYWRGATLSSSQDLIWTQNKSLSYKPSSKNQIGPTITQDISVDLKGSGVLFALDTPITVTTADSSTSIQSISEVEFEVSQNHGMFHYKAQSTLVHIDSLPLSERMNYTKLDFQPSEKSIQLAKTFDKNPGNAEIAALAMLSHFESQNFQYSTDLTLAINTMDQLLFEAKKGFCEHYAATAANLMRILDYPSRVVIGFYGGRFSRWTNTFIVRDLDAHAWLEVWSEQKQQWLRIDPTQVIAPQRMASDYHSSLLSSFFESTAPMLAFAYNNYLRGIESWSIANEEKFLGQIVQLAFNLWESVSWQTITLIHFLLLLVLWQLFKRRFRHKKNDPALMIYRRFCKKMQKRGFATTPQESATDFCLRIAKLNPIHEEALMNFSTLFNTIRYRSKTPDQKQLSRLRSTAKHISFK
jgi:hypothetical protein